MVRIKYLQPNTVWRLLSRACTPQERNEAERAIARLSDVNAPGPTGVCLLMRAARTANLFALDALLKAGANPNQTDRVPGAPWAPNPCLAYAFSDDAPSETTRQQVIERLVHAGADASLPEIWQSAGRRGPAAIGWLLDAAVMPEEPWSPILQGALTRVPLDEDRSAHLQGWSEIFERLVARGATPLHRDEHGRVTWNAAVLAIPDNQPVDDDWAEELKQRWEAVATAVSLQKAMVQTASAKRPRM